MSRSALSIVIPAHNEAQRLADSLDAVLAFAKCHLAAWEVIVVDDGSRDATGAIAREFAGVRVIENARNLGKGESVRRGVMAATLDKVLFTDTDLSAPIEEALLLFDAIEDGADAAIGVRRGRGEKAVKRTVMRGIMAAVFRWAVRVIALRGIEDTQCGFKMFRTSVARRIFPLQRTAGWTFDVELLVALRENGFRIAQVPISWHESGKSSVKLLSPPLMLLDLVRIRWSRLLGRYRLSSTSERASRGDRAGAAKNGR